MTYENSEEPTPLQKALATVDLAAQAARMNTVPDRDGAEIVHHPEPELGIEAAIAQAISVNPKKAMGSLKPGFHTVPMSVMLEVAEVMRLGAAKYGQKNWREQAIDTSTYYSAMLRHLLSWFEDAEDLDPESGQHHLAHVIANAMIVLDGQKQGKLIDDRRFQEAKVS